MSSPNSYANNGLIPAIQISNLSFTYEGSDRPALNDIQLNIMPGEFVILTGPSGSGKSTLARCLAGFIPQEYSGIFQGTVSIQGKDTQTQSIRGLARNISLIQQDPDSQLVTLNVTDEVAFGPENFQVPSEKISEKIRWALSAVSARALQNRSTQTLSGGEKQKVIIASFLAVQAPILVFDEPTTRLDLQTTQEVVKTLTQLHQEGATILVIEHRIEPFMLCASRALLLDEGRIRFDGTPKQLQKKSPILTELGIALRPSDYSQPISPAKPIKDEQSLLDIRNLTYTYPQTAESITCSPALQDISFSLLPGEVVALMGANGSGKSTLLLQLMGLLQPTTGMIYLEGQNIHDSPVSSLAQSIGFVFQNPLHQLFAPTVWEEVLLASQHLRIPETELACTRAKDLLEAFELYKYRDQSPFTLSLGEQRRLTIASILLHHPKLVLLDEPFIGQDYQNVHRLMATIQQVSPNDTTIVLVTHDFSIAETYCHRLLFLRSGHLLIDAPIKQGLTYLNQIGELTNHLEEIMEVPQ